MSYGWSSSVVRLVPLDEEKHLHNAHRWINDPDVTDFLLVGDFPTSLPAEREWLSTAQKGSTTSVSFAIETLDGRHIGQSGIHQIAWQHGTAVTGSFIGNTEDRGKGMGTAAAQLRSWYCFHVLGLRMLYSSHLSDNERSARMQAKSGYQPYGQQPRALWKRGAYRDLTLTYLDRERWLERTGGVLP